MKITLLLVKENISEEMTSELRCEDQGKSSHETDYLENITGGRNIRNCKCPSGNE